VLSAAVEVRRRDFLVCAELAVAPGERLALFGPSGAGKTTILETIAGLVRPQHAQITLGGRILTSTVPPRADVPPWRRRVGLLRQDPGLFPHLPVRANLAYGPGADGHGADLRALAGRLGIEGLLEAMPARLSGGQQHRVALGRLLLARCDTLLLDEPYAGLDASLRRGLTDLVRTLVADRAVPAVLVAHELEEAQAFADRLAVIDRGVVLQCGAPGDVVRHPASRRVAELVGYLGFVPVTGPVRAGPDGAHVLSPMATDVRAAGATAPGDGIGAGHGSAATAGPAEPGGPPGKAVRTGAEGTGAEGTGAEGTGAEGTGAASTVAGIHPERVVPGAQPGRGLVLTGPLTAVRPSGAGWEAELTVARQRITCRLPDRPEPDGGQLTVTALDPPLFGPDGAALDPAEQDTSMVSGSGPDGAAR
jgi:ABC-type sulfate/molybdate transport systems ATPase subunit